MITDNKKTLKHFINALHGAFDKDEMALFKKLSSEIDLTPINDGDTFEILLNYTFRKFLKGFVAFKFGDSDEIKFTLLNYQFLETHFIYWIKKKEGSPFSHDKSRAIMKSILDFHQTGKKTEWNYDGEYSYHLPKKIFKTHDEVIAFFNALKALFYGDPNQYLKCIKNYLKA